MPDPHCAPYCKRYLCLNTRPVLYHIRCRLLCNIHINENTSKVQKVHRNVWKIKKILENMREKKNTKNITNRDIFALLPRMFFAFFPFNFLNEIELIKELIVFCTFWTLLTLPLREFDTFDEVANIGILFHCAGHNNQIPGSVTALFIAYLSFFIIHTNKRQNDQSLKWLCHIFFFIV